MGTRPSETQAQKPTAHPAGSHIRTISICGDANVCQAQPMLTAIDGAGHA